MGDDDQGDAALVELFENVVFYLCVESLFLVACIVGDEGKNTNDNKQNNGRQYIHFYRSFNVEIKYSMRLCTKRAEIVIVAIPIIAPYVLRSDAFPAWDNSQPTKVMSETTITPSQNFR